MLNNGGGFGGSVVVTSVAALDFSHCEVQKCVTVVPVTRAGSWRCQGRKKQRLCVGHEAAAPLHPAGAQLAPSPPCAHGHIVPGLQN